MRSKRILGAVVVVPRGLHGRPGGPQEFRPTLQKIKDTGTIDLGYRETLKPGEIMRVTVLRDGRAVDLQTPWTGQ